jgi:putative ABC transport system substrate-binding protein
MARLGYGEGRNIAYDVRAADREAERLPRLARELVARKPDVIVSATERAGSALAEATRDIPIVLALVGDPVALGLTQSIARPTGNVTGFTTGNDTVLAKRLELWRSSGSGRTPSTGSSSSERVRPPRRSMSSCCRCP